MLNVLSCRGEDAHALYGSTNEKQVILVTKSLSEVSEIKTEMDALKEEIAEALCWSGKKGRERKVWEESEQGREINLGHEY